MRAPDPKAWELKFSELTEISSDDDEAAQYVVATVARRRALEELRALLPSCNAAQIHNRIAEIEAEGE